MRDEFLRRGEALYKNKQVLGALLLDFFADNQKLLKTLRLAVQENIAAKILEFLPLSSSEQKIRLSAIGAYFADDYDMSKSRATETVRILAYGAGIAEEALDVQITSKSDGTLPQAGEIYQFGGLDWRVLDIKGNQALIISEDILEQRQYHRDFVWVGITWEKCTLREYLNYEFYKSFAKADRERVIETNIDNHGNTWFNIKGGNETYDKIFLLSIEESDFYFGNSGDFKNKRRKKYNHDGILVSAENGSHISNVHDSDRIAMYCGEASWWWLRSPGGQSDAACVYGDGSVQLAGYTVPFRGFVGRGGVRPALWVQL